MINLVIGRIKFAGATSIWIVGAFEEYSKALAAKNQDYWRLVGDEDQEKAMRHLPHYEIFRLPPNDNGYWEIQ